MTTRVAAILCGALVLVSCTSNPKPAPSPTATPSGIVSVPDLAHTHTDQRVTYAQSPPVGGPHYPRWMKCGYFDDIVPSEVAVHSMEHGAVWLTRRADLDQAGRDALRRLFDLNTDYVLVTIYPDLPEPVVANAWGLQLRVSSPTDPRLEEFVTAYAGGAQGGEPGADCAKQGLTLSEAQRLFQ